MSGWWSILPSPFSLVISISDKNCNSALSHSKLSTHTLNLITTSARCTKRIMYTRNSILSRSSSGGGGVITQHHC